MAPIAALTPGTKIGSYEISALIGQGEIAMRLPRRRVPDIHRATPTNRAPRATAGLVIALILSLSVPLLASAQTPVAAAPAPLRTAWGDPDLRGVWDFRTLTPLQRGRARASQEFFTEEEVIEREREGAQRRANGFLLPFGTATTLTEDRRTSLIVDPPDGRIPALTPEAQTWTAAMRARYRRPPQSPEDRTMWDRCIVGRTSGPPMMPSLFHYDGMVHVFQTPGYVVMLSETIHEARIIPLDGSPHLGPNLRQWKGDSRGRWEGDTLVIESTNFVDPVNNAGAGIGHASNRIALLSADLHVVERLTRADADTMTYEFTVDDPKTFTKAWSARIPWKRTDSPILEFACHEGNYSMWSMLGAGRAIEADPTIEVRRLDRVPAAARVLVEAEAAAHGGARVERVEFLVDDAVVGVDSEPPYEVTWTTGGPGRHLVEAIVHDNLERVARSAPVAAFVGISALERFGGDLEDEAIEELSDGQVTVDVVGGGVRNVIEFGSGRVVGMRFSDVRIPAGAQVYEAYLRFTVGPARTDPTELTLRAESTGDAAAFTEVGRNVSTRKPTAASVAWSVAPWKVPGQSAESPNLAGLIQEVVDRPDWQEGNSLVLMVHGSGARRAVSYDGARRREQLEEAPRLYIRLRAEP